MYNFIYLIPIYNVQFLVNSIAKNLQTVRQTDMRYKLRGSLPINIIREAGESRQRKEKKGSLFRRLTFLPLNRISLLELEPGNVLSYYQS